MLKQANWKFFAITAITCLAATSLFAASQLWFHHCLWWECAPKRSFTVFDLELPVRYFPVSADIHTLKPLREDFASVEAAAATDYWDKGSAIYIVRRFATENQAVRDFDFAAAFQFTDPMEVKSVYADLIDRKSNIANQSRIACGYVQNDFRCIYAARYAEFTVFFNGSMGDGEISKDDFLSIIYYIDTRFKGLLK